MSKKRKTKFIAADETFSAGPISLARYGTTVAFHSSWPKDQYAEMQRPEPADYGHAYLQFNPAPEESRG
jgi:hypothetical protein